MNPRVLLDSVPWLSTPPSPSACWRPCQARLSLSPHCCGSRLHLQGHLGNLLHPTCFPSNVTLKLLPLQGGVCVSLLWTWVDSSVSVSTEECGAKERPPCGFRGLIAKISWPSGCSLLHMCVYISLCIYACYASQISIWTESVCLNLISWETVYIQYTHFKCTFQ